MIHKVEIASARQTACGMTRYPASRRRLAVAVDWFEVTCPLCRQGGERVPSKVPGGPPSGGASVVLAGHIPEQE